MRELQIYSGVARTHDLHEFWSRQLLCTLEKKKEEKEKKPYNKTQDERNNFELPAAARMKFLDDDFC